MESTNLPKNFAQAQRSLAGLKIISRLLSHELHAQSAAKAITLSRDEVVEIQTVIDVFIEEASRRPGAHTSAASESPLAVARN
jgi:hypothetical protein